MCVFFQEERQPACKRTLLREGKRCRRWKHNDLNHTNIMPFGRLFAAGLQLCVITSYSIHYTKLYDEEWRDRYLGLGYMQIDPVVDHCLKHVTPLPWDTVKPPEKKDRKVKQFLGEAREFGLKSGLSLPVHGSGGETALRNNFV